MEAVPRSAAIRHGLFCEFACRVVVEWRLCFWNLAMNQIFLSFECALILCAVNEAAFSLSVLWSLCGDGMMNGFSLLICGFGGRFAFIYGHCLLFCKVALILKYHCFLIFD